MGGPADTDTFYETDHLIFELIEERPKTQVWSVRNTHSDDFIGDIKWNPAWRKYCFFPQDCLVFDSNCLKTIVVFIDDLMKKHKERK